MHFTTDEIQMIRNERRQYEETGKIPANILEFIYNKQLFKLIVPEAFGGKMLDLPSATRIFQQAAYIDGNFGWLVTVGSGGGMFVPNMTEETTKTTYTARDAVIAGSGFPAGSAKLVEGGYRLKGKWFYCSGSQFATTFTVTCFVENTQTDTEKILAFALDPDQVNVLEDWDAFGLKGTSSHSIQVVDQFVPQHRAFSVFEQQNDDGYDVHTFPFVPFSEASFTAVSLGIGQHFLDEVAAVLEKNKQNWQEGLFDRYTLLIAKLSEEKERLEKADEAFHEQLHLAWQQHTQSGEVAEDVLREFSTIAKRSASTAVHCANNLFRYIGMQMVRETNMLNQILRDLMTASQHMFLTPYQEAEAIPF